MKFKTIVDKVDAIKKGNFSCVENVLNYNKKILTEEIKDLNIFLSLNKEAINQAKEIDKKIKEGKKVGKLAGVCFAVKSCISVKGFETNCGSKVLEGYISPYNATVINKLLNEDAIFLGMVNMDEFACGASGETSAYGPTKNPLNPELIPGGSSSGSAASVCADLCDFALGSDTGGSIRNPASHCGIVGLKPTYGAVSRYGLIDMCMSLDCIGPLTKNLSDAKLIFDIIKGHDYLDNTTGEEKYKKKLKKIIGIVEVEEFCDDKIYSLFKEKIKEISKKTNYQVKVVKLPLDIFIETYYILVYTEFFSGTRKFDGRRFGKAIDTFGGPEVQRRIIGGSQITRAEFDGKYYRNALKSRSFITDSIDLIFKDVDFILMPTVPRTAHKIGEEISIEEMYNYDIFTALANIAKIPAISIPMGEIDSKKVGLQILGPCFSEEEIFNFCNLLK
ncbi:MAG: amidase family protein [Candidatus Pacearchaeota archaeon]